MGLDFTFHNSMLAPPDAVYDSILDFSDFEFPHWSYRGFARFRDRIAEAIGFADLSDMPGYCPHANPIAWSTIDSPLVPLLNHSDCDGILTARECRQMATPLRDLVETWPEDDEHREAGLCLALCMGVLGACDLDLVFC